MILRCPRCGLSLSDLEYEGERTRVCKTCFGHWLKRSQLDTGEIKDLQVFVETKLRDRKGTK